jgi:hypothetical protein
MAYTVSYKSLFPRRGLSFWRSLGDRSLWGLLFCNMVVMVWAVVERWPLNELLWIYWAQSVLIGAFNALRMFTVKRFSTDGLTMDNQPVPETPAGQKKLATFFCLHFGFFHVIYAVMLLALFHAKLPPRFALFVALFLVNELAGYLRSRAEEQAVVWNLGYLLFSPYPRILPMHLVIIFGALLQHWWGTTIFFLALKTGADLVMYLADKARQPAPQEPLPLQPV